MIGDADGFKYHSIVSDSFQGSYLEELANILENAIYRAKKGLSGAQSQALREKVVNDVLSSDELRSVAVEDEAYAEDHASEYLYDIGYSESDVLGIADPYKLELSYFDDNGDEFTVFTVDQKKEVF